jgi:hypothetical protein
VSRPIESTQPDRIAALHATRDRFSGNVASAQETRLLVAMQELGHVTTFEASRYLDVYHPPARKLALIKRGCQILTTWRRVPTESGRSHRIGVYSLVKGNEQRSAAQVDRA